ncbi:hypothetical protein TWF173_001222 [Orbilia oligospora]|nr:hypothetical protein TWF173_001222 [Orbilia oligospora]
MQLQHPSRYVSETRALDWVEDNGCWAAGPQTADENGRRDEKGDDEEGLGLGVTPKTLPSTDLGWPKQKFQGTVHATGHATMCHGQRRSWYGTKYSK